MKVGVLAASISRRAGGLFWSVRSLAKGLEESGCNVEVFSIADRYSAEDVMQWQDVELRLLTGRGPGAFGYAPGFARALNSTTLDLVHTHGLWMYPSVAALHWSKRWGRPLVVSPRGMLDPWAVGNSSRKKRIAGMLFEHAHLRHAKCLHALSESEYRAIRGYGLANPVAIIPNGVDLPDLSRIQPESNWGSNLPSDSRCLLFLSRIHPKKGLRNLLHAWARVKQECTSAAKPWHLIIAGWDQGGHQQELEQLSATLGLRESVHFVGPQFDERKAASLIRAEAFILPSMSEGMPMAVLEAWAYRLPVLMTPQCNLPEGFAAKAALEMAPEAASISVALKRLFDMTESERRTMRDRGFRLVQERFAWPPVAASMRTVYAWVLGQGTKPDCVFTD
jgi:glycosyltransferase involved in cell wall biosynthesis